MPLPLMTRLRIYCLQQFYELSDPGAEQALYDSESMRRFAGTELGEDAVPDESRILQFRRLLECHNLTAAILKGWASAFVVEVKGEVPPAPWPVSVLWWPTQTTHRLMSPDFFWQAEYSCSVAPVVARPVGATVAGAGYPRRPWYAITLRATTGTIRYRIGLSRSHP